MKFALGTSFATLFLASALVASYAGSDEPRRIPSRTLPMPSTGSPALKELLGRDLTFPQSVEGLRQWIGETPTAEAKRKEHEQVRSLSNKFGVTVTERDIGGVPCYEIVPNDVDVPNRERLLVDLHGGGWLFSGESPASLGAIVLAGLSRIRTIAVDYRDGPSHPFPVPIEDSLSVWKSLVKSAKPEKTALTGSSAGGGMVLSVVQRAKREGIPLPGALVVDSPLVDLSKTGDSYYTNEWIDNRIRSYDGFVASAVALYAGGHKNLKDPLISPIYGDFSGFPATFIVTGTRDLLLSHAARLQQKLMEAGVSNQLYVGEGLTHGIIIEAATADIPEALRVYSYIAKFLDAHLER